MTEARPLVLIVDDDPQIRRFLRAGFDLEKFRIIEEETAAGGLRAATLQSVDLIVLDLNLPDMDGAAIVERIRAWSTVPIIVLSVRAGDEDKIRLLEAGANDYVVRGSPTVKVGQQLTVDLANRAVFVRGARVTLSPKEYRLLQVLAQHAGNVVTHSMLLKEIWGVRHLQHGHYLRILVRRLRRKIEQDPKRPRILVSEAGVGYRLLASDD
jgi:two-component system KDP operon response regulator KdpE